MGSGFEFAESLRFWHWWILGVILLGLEIVLPGTFFLWMGAAAGVVGLVMLFVPGFAWEGQVLAFASLSVVTVVAGRLWLRSHPTETADPTLNERGAQYVGRVVQLAGPLVDGVGKARVGDTLWRVSTGDNTDLPEGARVRITGVEGATLTVKPATAPEAAA